MNFDGQGQENGLTASTPRHDLTITENLHTFVRDDTIPPSPTSDDNQSATATPTKDTVTPDVKAAKRKATRRKATRRKKAGKKKATRKKARRKKAGKKKAARRKRRR